MRRQNDDDNVDDADDDAGDADDDAIDDGASFNDDDDDVTGRGRCRRLEKLSHCNATKKGKSQ